MSACIMIDRAIVPDASTRVELKGAAIGAAALDVAAFQVIQAHRQRSWDTFFAAAARSTRGRVIGPPPIITTTGNLPYYGTDPSGPARYA